jgi:uncharacterized membrane protein
MLFSLGYIALLLILVLLIRTTYSVAVAMRNEKALEESTEAPDNAFWLEKMGESQGFLYFGIVVTIVSLLGYTYFLVLGTPWERHLMEWLNIVVRLMHITFGIAWIGASFYFVFLENALNRTKNVRDELAGNLWAVHGGGFYYLEKYKIAPKEIPRDLHWFKYEAYFTWASGIALMFVVYYFNASAFLIDKNVLDIAPGWAIALGIGSFAFAWVLYDALCKTPLVRKGIWFALPGFLIAAGFAYGYTHVFSARAAYMHFGGMLGTIMAANVFFNIIPAQKAMVKAAKEGLPLDPMLGKNAGLRSLHNNYFTLPVLFVMVSNHFPSTFGNANPWLVLLVISLGVAGIKHYLNLREKGEISVWVAPISVLILLSAVMLTAPALDPGACKAVSFAEVQPIITKRCTSCHSSKPTDDTWTAPPNGVVYDTPADIVKLKDKIMERVVITLTMPQNNKTGMTPEERNIIRCWIEQGADIK